MGFLPGDPLRQELEWEAHTFVRVNAWRALACHPRVFAPASRSPGSAFASPRDGDEGAARPARRSVSRLQVRRSTR